MFNNFFPEARLNVVTTDTIVRIGVPCDRTDSPCEKLQVLPEALVADPICGSDGVTYSNSLALMCAMTTDPSECKLSSITLQFETHQRNII
jgi:hypothetical protein